MNQILQNMLRKKVIVLNTMVVGGDVLKGKKV